MFRPSGYLKDMVRAMCETLLFRHGKLFGCFLWLTVWVLPFTVAGWYIGDILNAD